MREGTTITVDDDLDRPTISTARLEELFGSMRDELATGVRAPATDAVMRRAAGRRRRRRGAVGFVAAALAFTGLWGLTLLPGGGGDGTSSVGPAAAEQTLSPVLELPGPDLGSGLPGVVGEARPTPGSLMDRSTFGLLLSPGQLPTVDGLYGPWVQVEGWAATPSVPSFAAGCGQGLVEFSGAVQRWEFDYADTAGHSATARQYVLDFDSEQAAIAGGALFRTGAECTASGAGWTLEDQTPATAAVRRRGPDPVIEEMTARVVGKRLVVLLVHRKESTVAAVVNVAGAFRDAAAALAARPGP
ncbi:hypothetical protein [Kitasatospora sp. McL0602]|uniref:hypothetical protein n=1 Tax=Kitasatospora sp. McL0602 TaxID=3439530 RepID=UPI003F8BD076